MNELIELTKTTGIAFACLCALAFAVWRTLVYIAHQAFGNPAANPPTKGFVTEWLECQKKFHDAMIDQGERQMASCDQHNARMNGVDLVLNRTDQQISELVKLHVDSTIPNSTAQAIHNIAQLKLAAMCACNGCREAMSNSQEPVSQIVIRKCDEIEQILTSSVHRGIQT